MKSICSALLSFGLNICLGQQPQVLLEAGGTKGCRLVECTAEFEGGWESLIRFFQEQVTYPRAAVLDSITGTVEVLFAVDHEGYVRDATILRGIGAGCDQEVLRVVNLMPRWIPASNGGEALTMYFVLPVRFAGANDEAREREQVRETSFSQTRATVSPIRNVALNHWGTGTIHDFAISGCDTSYTYDTVDSMPQFLGGQQALDDFLRTNIRWPHGTCGEGAILIKFTIWCDGSVRDAAVLRGINESLDQEALRVTRMLPKWESGSVNGAPVPVYYTIPIRFLLNG
jgi:TonB family protein